MADDTREQSSKTDDLPINKDTLTVNPENKPFTGTQWQGGKQIPYTPPTNANMMAGGTENTAGGKVPDVTIGNAFPEGLKMKDFSELVRRPCVRDSLLYGIGAGFATGGTRFIFRSTVAKASNWAVGSFCLVSAGMYQFCLYQRQAEKEGMKRAVEILNSKEMEKKAREARREKVREERRLAKEQEQDQQFAALKGKSEGQDGKAWWKVW